MFQILVKEGGIDEGIGLLNAYPYHFDAEKVIDLLPGDTLLPKLATFLEKYFLRNQHAQRQQKVEESLYAQYYLRT